MGLKLLRNIRFYVLTGSIVLSFLIYLGVLIIYPEGSIQTSRLQQIYALLSVTYLYLALLAGPLCYTFKIPFASKYLKARRALGVSAFYYGLLHASISFFIQLGGFPGLGYLSNTYLIAISLSFTALLILFFMTITSVDKVIAWMKFRRWKMLHRLVYLASVLILIHALMLGTHFRDLSTAIPQIFFAAFAILLMLEANRFDVFVQKKFTGLPRFGIFGTLVIGFIAFSYIYSLLPSGTTLPLGIHTQHIQIAKEAQLGTGVGAQNGLPNIPGLRGDRTKRFTLDWSFPETVGANQDTTLSFKVSDSSSGNQVFLFNKVYGKQVHLIIVDSSLSYFSHIHPEFKDGSFSITTQLPKDGVYHLYADFQPFGAIEQQIASTLTVGAVEKPERASTRQDSNSTKVFGQYAVALKTPNPLRSSEISIGKQLFSFTITDAVTKKPVTNLKPYLEAFGHLVMINEKTYEYVHVHPNDLRVPQPNANGGPTVEFMPLGLYGPIKPGLYRVFAQFNPNNELFTADFTVEIK